MPKHLSGKVWEDVLLLLVGSQFGCTISDKPEVLGAVLAVKHAKVDAISIWHRTANNAEVKELIRAAFDQVL